VVSDRSGIVPCLRRAGLDRFIAFRTTTIVMTLVVPQLLRDFYALSPPRNPFFQPRRAQYWTADGRTARLSDVVGDQNDMHTKITRIAWIYGFRRINQRSIVAITRLLLWYTAAGLASNNEASPHARSR